MKARPLTCFQVKSEQKKGMPRKESRRILLLSRAPCSSCLSVSLCESDARTMSAMCRASFISSMLSSQRSSSLLLSFLRYYEEKDRGIMALCVLCLRLFALFVRGRRDRCERKDRSSFISSVSPLCAPCCC